MQANHCNIHYNNLARNSKFKVRSATGFHLGFSSRGGRDYSMFFPFVKNDVVLIKLIILGGSGGMLSQENF